MDRGTNETPGSESKGGRKKLHLGPPYKPNMSYRMYTPMVLLDYGHPISLNLNAYPSQPPFDRLLWVSGGCASCAWPPEGQSPRLSASPMGPAQAPLPCSTGGPIANSDLLAVFPHELPWPGPSA
jgi:hypothetical protein